jgi:hypothetical protein
MHAEAPPTVNLRNRFDNVLLAILWRYLCHAAMLLVCLLGERIPAAGLYDRIIAVTPYVPIVAQYNYHLWVAAYIPIAVWFWRIDRDRFVAFMYTGGIVSLLRGLCIFLTSLGPVNGRDINAGASIASLIDSWITLVNPVSALTSSAPNIYLTKDLFFSGHTASTFLLWLYVRSYAKIGPIALVAHVVVVASVFLSHLHYTIDVIGAWAITFSVFTLSERWVGRKNRAAPKVA